MSDVVGQEIDSPGPETCLNCRTFTSRVRVVGEWSTFKENSTFLVCLTVENFVGRSFVPPFQSKIYLVSLSLFRVLFFELYLNPSKALKVFDHQVSPVIKNTRNSPGRTKEPGTTTERGKVLGTRGDTTRRGCGVGFRSGERTGVG